MRILSNIKNIVYNLNTQSYMHRHTHDTITQQGARY